MGFGKKIEKIIEEVVGRLEEEHQWKIRLLDRDTLLSYHLGGEVVPSDADDYSYSIGNFSPIRIESLSNAAIAREIKKHGCSVGECKHSSNLNEEIVFDAIQVGTPQFENDLVESFIAKLLNIRQKIEDLD